MKRTVLGILTLVLIGVAPLQADDIRGKLKKVDPKKGIISLLIDDKVVEFTIDKKTDIQVQDVRNYKPKNGLMDPVFKRTGLQVRLVVEKKAGGVAVTSLMIYTGRRG